MTLASWRPDEAKPTSTAKRRVNWRLGGVVGAALAVACRAPERVEVAATLPVSQPRPVEMAVEPRNEPSRLLMSAERPGGPAIEVWRVPDGGEWRVIAALVPADPDGREHVFELGRQWSGIDMMRGTLPLGVQLSSGLCLLRTTEDHLWGSPHHDRWLVFDASARLVSDELCPLGPGEGGLADSKRIQVDVLETAPLLFVAWMGRTNDGELALWCELRDGRGWSSAALEVFRRPFSRPGARVADEPIVRCLSFSAVSSSEWIASHCLSDLAWTIRVTNAPGASDPMSCALECTSAGKQ